MVMDQSKRLRKAPKTFVELPQNQQPVVFKPSVAAKRPRAIFEASQASSSSSKLSATSAPMVKEAKVPSSPKGKNKTTEASAAVGRGTEAHSNTHAPKPPVDDHLEIANVAFQPCDLYSHVSFKEENNYRTQKSISWVP